MTNLEDVLQEIDSRMPGFGKHTSSKSDKWYSGDNEWLVTLYYVTGVRYTENDKYKVAVCKWLQDTWSTKYPGNRRSSWLSIYYKDEPGRIHTQETPNVTLRELYKPDNYHSNVLESFNDAGAEWITPNQIKIYWSDGVGGKGPSYLIDLE